MSFDEKKFLELLHGVDATLSKIKQIANYMMYHRELYHDKITDAWVRQIHSVPSERKLLLVYVANEVLLQTYRKGKTEYIRDFGDAFMDSFKDFAKSTESVETLTLLVKLCDQWETELIYANNFMEYLRKIIRARIGELDVTGELNSKLDPSTSLLNDFRLINRWEICNNNFTFDLQEENIKGIYESVDKEKFNNLLSFNIATPGTESSKLKELNEYEHKLKELKKLLITDLANREKFILNISDFILKEKDVYFSNLEQSKSNK